MQPVADQFPNTPVRQTIYMEWHYLRKFSWDGSRYSEQSRTDLLYWIHF